MPPKLELDPGRFYTPTPEEQAALREADLKNALILGSKTGDTCDDYRVLSQADEVVVADLCEQQALAEEGAVQF